MRILWKRAERSGWKYEQAHQAIHTKEG